MKEKWLGLIRLNFRENHFKSSRILMFLLLTEANTLKICFHDKTIMLVIQEGITES